MSWLFVRQRAWWYNKIPLSFMLVLLLADGKPLDIAVGVLFLTVVLAVSGAANYGYAINELFDVEEDALIGRGNAAARLGRPRMWLVAVVSASLSLACAAIGGGVQAMALTVLELCLPLAYSVPPVRVKERKWLGVASDALAAHVYPAVLALIVAQHLGIRSVTPALVAFAVAWALSAGVRGILSHQLHTADQDRAAGLRTVVSDIGAPRLERGIVALLVPLEAVSFAGTVFLCSPGIIAWLFLAAYALYEGYKTAAGRFEVMAFRRQGQPYIPMLEESLYKAWGPLVFAFDAARVDVRYLVFVPLYIGLFMPHMRIEWHRMRVLFGAK
ncbi:MAG TPA: UbiA family prenyltransferase [Candidatus Rubrimentiphilum sp.]|nr:UbiA family prenyltransferase [Candidatus Rubrimentiphilum sp.]